MLSKSLALTAFLSLVLAAVPARSAPRIDEGLYELGSKICADIANGELVLPGTQAHIDRIDEVGWERAEFCHCVGQEFGMNRAQKARMEISEGDAANRAILEILLTNMTLCSSGLQVYSDYITSKDDAWQCRQVIDGDRKMLGLDLTAVRAAMSEHGMDREDVCSCAAGFITAMEKLIDAKPLGIAMPSASYQMQMATGIQHCTYL